MNAILEEKLRELIDETERQGAFAANTVLNQLLGACLEGKEGKFAKHCTQFSPLLISKMAATQNDEFDLEVRAAGYIN